MRFQTRKSNPRFFCFVVYIRCLVFKFEIQGAHKRRLHYIHVSWDGCTCTGHRLVCRRANVFWERSAWKTSLSVWMDEMNVPFHLVTFVATLIFLCYYKQQTERQAILQTASASFSPSVVFCFNFLQMVLKVQTIPSKFCPRPLHTSWIGSDLVPVWAKWHSWQFGPFVLFLLKISLFSTMLLRDNTLISVQMNTVSWMRGWLDHPRKPNHISLVPVSFFYTQQNYTLEETREELHTCRNIWCFFLCLAPIPLWYNRESFFLCDV